MGLNHDFLEQSSPHLKSRGTRFLSAFLALFGLFFLQTLNAAPPVSASATAFFESNFDRKKGPEKGSEPGSVEPLVAGPAIGIAQQVSACSAVGGGNLRVTFQVIVQNGSSGTAISFANVSATLATQFGPFFVSATGPVNLVPFGGAGVPAVNGGFNGAGVTAMFSGPSAMPVGGGFTFEYNVIVDPNAAPFRPDCQLLAFANGGAIDDESDSGFDPIGPNSFAFGDLLHDVVDIDSNGNPDDDGDGSGAGADEFDNPTPVPMTRVSLTKEVVGFADAASGVIGNQDVEFHLIIENTGTEPFDRVLLIDDLQTQLGGGLVQIISYAVNATQTTAYVDPIVNPAYTGTSAHPQVFNSNTGYVRAGEIVDVTIIAEINPAATNCSAVNSANVSARAGLEVIPGILTPITMPDGSQKIIMDISDSGNVPESFNTGQPGGTPLNEDDPTPVMLPQVRLVKRVVETTPVVDPTNCTKNYTVVFEYVLKNTGNRPLTNVRLFDQLNAGGNLGAGFVSVTGVTVLAGAATSNFPAYNGTSAAVSAINLAGPMACGASTTVRITAIVNSDLSPAPMVNQAEARANWQITGQPLGTISDFSDSGADVDSYNNAAIGAQFDDQNDPTFVFLPRINAAKTVVSAVPAASGVIGNFDVTFRVVVANTGNTDLDRLQVDDLNIPAANVVAVISEPTETAAQTANIAPVFSPGFSGDGLVFDGTSGLLKADEQLVFEFTLEMNADATCLPMNQVLATGRGLDIDGIAVLDPISGLEKVMTDLSDSGTDPRTNNAAAPSSAAGCDDPTPVELPQIKVTKAVQSATQIVDPTGCTNNYDVTFAYVIENTGSISLNNVRLFDQLNAVGNLGAGFVSFTAVAVTSGPATLNAGYNGTSAATSAITSTGLLTCGSQIRLTIRAIFNADLTTLPPTNQAQAQGGFSLTNTPATTGTVTDLSDSGTDPESPNDAAPGATLGGLPEQHDDDATPVYLPKIKTSKEVIACGMAASATLGNMDVTVRFRIQNTGNVALQNICLTDDIKAQLGAATIVDVPFYEITAATTASEWPELVNGYVGSGNLFDCLSGLLRPDEVIEVVVVFEVNPNAAGAVLPALNQSTARGEALDFNLLPLGLTVSDISDGGSNPNAPNTGYPGNTGGCNDRTPISLPQLLAAKEVIACVPKGPFDPGDFLVTFKTRIQNTGNVRLEGISAADILAAQIGAAFIAVTQAPTVISSNAGSPAPAANAAFNAAANSNLLQANASILNPGGVIEIIWQAEINPNALLPQDSLTNQILAAGRGLHPNVAGGLVNNQVVVDPVTLAQKVVQDLSDAGSVPESYNVGEPGDRSESGAPWLGSNDPTPIEIPSINISKKVIGAVPSGDDLPGEFDVTFLVKVENTGNVNLADFTVDDDIRAGLGAAYLELLEAPHYVAPYLQWDFPGVFNPDFDGAGDVHIFQNDFNLLLPGETFSLEYKIRVNPNALLPTQFLKNQAVAAGRGVRADGSDVESPKDGPGGGPVKRTTDLSDDGFLPENLNLTQRGNNIPVAGTHDNPTPLEIPSTNLSKFVVSIIKVPGEVPPGNARLTFDIKMENTGNVQLRNLLIDDAVRTQMGSAWVGFAPGGLPTIFTSNATVNPTLNAGFTGLAGAGGQIFNGTTGRLDPGQTIRIRMIVDLDPNAINVPTPLLNQAFGKGSGFNWVDPSTPSATFVPVPDVNTNTAGPMMTTDASDSGQVPESNNPNEPNDSGIHNDPTPFEIPFNLASKWEIPNIMGTMCARSEVDGSVDLTWLIKYVNVGNTWLTNLQVMDDLLQQFGPNFVKVYPGAVDVREELSNATELPSVNFLYNGSPNSNLLAGNDGILAPNEFFVVQVQAEINPNVPGTIKPYDNQAMVFGLAVREDGTKVFVPTTMLDFVWDDRTDAGELPETTGLGYPGDTGGSNDPYDFRLPMSTAFAEDLIIYPNCFTGIDEYLIPWIDAHGGAVVMAHPQCGPIEWTSNWMGGLNWMPAEEYFCGCGGRWEFEWNAKDQCGHDVCHDAFLEVRDTAAPCWDMYPMSKTFYCGSGLDDDIQGWLDSLGGAWFLDNCSAELETWNDFNPATATACSGAGQVVTFYVRDQCGNTTSAKATLKVIDDEAPTLSNVPANLTINCNSPVPAPANVTAHDNCQAPPVITMTQTQTAGSCPGEVIYIRTWTARDLCGNSSSATQTISKKDITKPFFTSAPANLTITCPALPVFGNVQVSDVCAGAAGVAVTFLDKVIAGTSCPAGYTVRRTWTATDLCGNTRTIFRTIEVLPDPNPPVPSSITFEAISDKTIACDEAVVFGNPTATTTCLNGMASVTFSDVSTAGGCAAASLFTRTWTATDVCGSTKKLSQTITQMPDSQPPVFSFSPADLTVNCGQTAAFGTPVFSDNCSSQPVLTFSDDSNGKSCALGELAQKSRTWTATDACGRTATAKQTISELPQVTALQLVSFPPAAEINCGQALVFGQPVAATSCTTGAITMNFTDSSVGLGGCEDIFHTRTWAIKDGCGNQISASQTIKVKADATAPTFSNVPVSLIVDCNTLIPAAQPTVSDNCSATPSLNFLIEPLGPNPCTMMSGNQALIIWIAQDACGNTGRDTTLGFTSGAPSSIVFISEPQAPHTYSCGEPMVWDTPVCVSGCGIDPKVKLLYSETTGGDCATGTFVTRTWTATDLCGNEAHCEHTQYFAADQTAPTLSFATNFDLLPCGQAVPLFPPGADDNCSTPTVSALGDLQSGDLFQRTWVATDACGNTSTAIQYFIFLDDVAPIFTQVPQNQTIECGQSVDFGSVSATDDCSSATAISFVDLIQNGSCTAEKTILRTWTATDEKGNATTATASIKVEDKTKPVFSTVPTDATISCEAPLAIPAPAASDCSGATVLFVDAFVQGNCTGEYVVTRTWTATDGCGNTATADVKMTIVDDVAPVLDVAGMTDLALTFFDFQSVQTAVGATDNCGFVSLGQPQIVAVQNGCELAYKMTWTATDDCGNAAQKTVNIDILDENPTISSASPTLFQTGQQPVFVAETAGGAGPFGLAWTVTGSGWFISAGDGTLKPTIVVGTGDCFLTLTITNAVGCTTTKTWLLSAESVSTTTISEVKMELFPVPTFDRATLEMTLTTAQTIEMRLLDEAGKLIEIRKTAGKTGRNTELFDLSKQSAGTYLLEIRTPDGALLGSKMIVKL